MKPIINWNQTILDIGPRLYRYFCGCFPEHQAADLVQEVLIRLVRKVQEAQVDENKGSIRMYAFGIARFVRLEGKRALFFHPLSTGFEEYEESKQEGIQENASPMDVYEKTQQMNRLRQSIKSLPEEQQEVLLLYLDQDLTLPEIGDILGMPVNTIKSHLHRAKALLKQRLQG